LESCWFPTSQDLQDLYGVAEPISADENLDITAPKPKASSAVDVAKPPVAKEDKPKSKVPVLATSEDGLSAGQKLFFVGAIVAVCALFLRSRGGKSTVSLDRLKEKSMA
jgi:peptidyl-prolyl cis-trans isomerase B (cyclophilin B)